VVDFHKESISQPKSSSPAGNAHDTEFGEPGETKQLPFQMLTVAEVADALRVGRSTAYQLIDVGKIPSVKIGSGRGTIRVLLEDLRAFVENARRGEPSPPPPRKRNIRLKHLKL